jgi:hypothetical protein
MKLAPNQYAQLLQGVGGLLQRRRSNPWESEVKSAYDNMRTMEQQEQGYADEYGDIRQRYQPQALEAVDNYADLLRIGTTDQERSRLTARNSQNVTDSYLRARSRLQSQLARTGNVGMYAGSMANLEGMRAAAGADAANRAADYFDQQQYNRAQSLSSLLSGTADYYNGQEQAARGRASGYLGKRYGIAESQMAQANAQQDNTWREVLNSLGMALR